MRAAKQDRHFQQSGGGGAVRVRDSAAGETTPETAKICRKKQNHFWRAVSHQKWQARLQKAGLGQDEAIMFQRKR